MINGRFVCIGNTNYLKNKYGSGYKITLSRGPKLESHTMAEVMRDISMEAEFLELDESAKNETYQVGEMLLSHINSRN